MVYNDIYNSILYQGSPIQTEFWIDSKIVVLFKICLT